MDNKIRIYDVNLGPAVKALLSKWMILLIVAIATALLAVIGVKLVKNHIPEHPIADDVEIIMEITDDEMAGELEALLSDEEKSVINICLERIKKLEKTKEYMASAALFKLDPYNARRLIVEYEASADQIIKARGITSQYIDYVNKDDRYKNALSEAVGDNDDSYHISDLISAGESTALSEDDASIVRIQFGIYLLDDWDYETVVNAIRNQIEEYVLPEPPEDETFKFTYVKDTELRKYYPDINILQNNALNQYNADISFVNYSASTLTRSAKILYNYTLKNNGLYEEYNVEIPEPTVTTDNTNM